MIAFDQNLFTIIFPFSFLCFFLFCLGIIQYMKVLTRKRKIIKKIQQGGFDEGLPSRKIADETQERTKSGRNLFAGFFSLFGKGQSNTSLYSRSFKFKFLKAGIKYENFETAFYGAKLFLPLFLVGAFLISRLYFLKLMTALPTISILVLLGLLGFYLPEIWLKIKTDKRKIVIFKGLPDALDLLIVCVEAGMGLDAALQRVGDEMKMSYPDLSHEFSFLNLEMRAGMQRQDALRNLANRTGIEEMNSLITLLIQTDKFGTSVAKALQVFSDSFRTKRFQKAEEIAAKLPVMILIPLILCIFPALFVVIIGPAAITIYQNLILG